MCREFLVGAVGIEIQMNLPKLRISMAWKLPLHLYLQHSAAFPLPATRNHNGDVVLLLPKPILFHPIVNVLSDFGGLQIPISAQ